MTVAGQTQIATATTMRIADEHYAFGCGRVDLRQRESSNDADVAERVTIESAYDVSSQANLHAAGYPRWGSHLHL
jgi:hypothetical protein